MCICSYTHTDMKRIGFLILCVYIAFVDMSTWTDHLSTTGLHRPLLSNQTQELLCNLFHLFCPSFIQSSLLFSLLMDPYLALEWHLINCGNNYVISLCGVWGCLCALFIFYLSIFCVLAFHNGQFCLMSACALCLQTVCVVYMRLVVCKAIRTFYMLTNK